MIHRIYTLLLLGITTVSLGMQDLEFRQQVNDITDLYKMAPQWLESDQLQHLVNSKLLAELGFPPPDLSIPAQPLDRMGGELPPPQSEYFTQSPDSNHFEVNRNLESLQQQQSPYRGYSSIPNPMPNLESLAGWMHRDSWIFPFVAAPDMSNDSEINRYRVSLERNDASSLAHEIQSQRSNLENSSFIDRYNRYMISRRLSFIAKNVRQNPAMHYLLSIHKANNLEAACSSLEQLSNLLKVRDSITINGQTVKLDDQKVAGVMRVAQQLIKNRSDYRAESSRYPEASMGGQLLDRGPILDRLDRALNSAKQSRDVQNSFQQNVSGYADLINTTVIPVDQLSPYLNQALIESIQALKQDGELDLDQYFKILESNLAKMEQAGLFKQHESKDMLVHGFKHFLSSLKPNDPRENPREFALNVVKYTGLVAFHGFTGGAFVPAQMAISIGLQAQRLMGLDTANMTQEQMVEVVAEELATVAWDIAVAKAAPIIQDKAVKLGSNLLKRVQPRTQQYAVLKTTDGGELKILQPLEDANVLKNASDKVVGSSLKAVNPNGIYKDAGYHSLKGNSVKSARPINGQHALDNSFQIKNLNKPRRIAVSNGEFVVLDRTMGNEFHGHVRTWKELDDNMQNTLIEMGLVTPRGKIIK